MEELLARGEIAAAIPPWHFVARMVGTGQYREVMAATEMLFELGMSSDLPILVVAARDDLSPEALRSFLEGMDMTIARMQQDEEIWELILAEELYTLPEPALFPEVIRRWEAGIPQLWNEEIMAGLAALVDEMAALAGAEVVGVESFNPEAYTTELSPTSR